MHVSNFRAVKRVRDVVRIFARVAATMNARLVLVGDGPDSGAAFDEAQSLGVSDRVQFLGLVDDVLPILAAADLLLLPSETESFGLAALEAMASGIPVVGSNTGGLPEVVEHGVTGMLAPVGDVQTMADYALRVLRNSEVFTSLCTAARNRAERLFDCSRIIPQYESVYQRVLGSIGP